MNRVNHSHLLALFKLTTDLVGNRHHLGLSNYSNQGRETERPDVKFPGCSTKRYEQTKQQQKLTLFHYYIHVYHTRQKTH